MNDETAKAALRILTQRGVIKTWGAAEVRAMEAALGSSGMNVAQHRDHFRGRCALALQACSKITNNLANAIRISPMDGCVDVGAIDACREQVAKMAHWLDEAEESARTVRSAERDGGQA